ncbi:MAG: hypothetical protein M1438_16280 [Deltaproteobacteria bacterium]|nr:hypothetical protein [Deltaproteobacteria bacterium]
MNVYLSECQYLPSGLKFSAWRRHGRPALALPQDAPTYLLEITKFLATGALILATGVLMLMLG